MKKQKILLANSKMQKSFALMVILMLTIKFSMAQHGGNLVRNGTFEMGRTGFNTDYKLIEGHTNPGKYAVTDDVTRYVADGVFKNPIPYTGKFLYIDAFDFPDPGPVNFKRCWYDSVSVKPDTTYIFSCSVASVMKRLPPQLKFYVNGESISEIFFVYDHTWKTISAKYTTKPEQTRIEISIVNVNKESSYGNDFAIDNIFFGFEKPETEIPTVILETQSSCNGNLGSPVFFENFGKQSSCYSSTELPSGTTNYKFKGIGPGPKRNPPDEGEYVIWCGSSAGVSRGLWHQTFYDHTTGTGAGAGSNMAIFNAGAKPGEFYRKNISGLCQNTNYTFSVHVANLADPANEVTACGASGSIKPNLEFKIYNAGTTTLLASGKTGEIPLSSRFTWLYYDFSFRTKPGQTSVDVVLQNLAQGGCGNDLALDDISVRPCSPSLEISLSPANTVQAGTSVTFNGTIGAGFTNPVYQWQSGSDGTTWTDIAGATSINHTIPNTSVTDSRQYRLLAAENRNLINARCRINSDSVILSVTESLAFKTGTSEILKNVFFDKDKVELLQESKAELDKLYNLLKSSPDLFILISGHTDNKASSEYNQTLSEARAVVVVQYFIDKGLDKNKVMAKGFGDTRPIASNEDEEGRKQNRRVEFMILDPKDDTHNKQLSLQDPSVIKPGDERYNQLMEDIKAVY